MSQGPPTQEQQERADREMADALREFPALDNKIKWASIQTQSDDTRRDVVKSAFLWHRTKKP